MSEEKIITVNSNKKDIQINVDRILYVLMEKNIAEIHVLGNNVYRTRITLSELETLLGDNFIKVHRSCLVSALAIHDITKTINLNNGESLDYVTRKKKEIIAALREKQKEIIKRFNDECPLKTDEEFHEYYKSFDEMPFAFTDIEMVFGDELRAVDWIFRYGNKELANLEKFPLENLIGKSFGSIFSNMDPKWLRCYERATLFRETLEIIDYSPEIDAYLDIICFPTFRGHCGCILFDISQVKFAQENNESKKALMLYLSRMTDIKNAL